MSIKKMLHNYFVSEYDFYGFAIIIKKYASFPVWIPLPAHFEHGWTIHLEPLKTDLVKKKRLMLVFSKRRAVAWERHSEVPVAVMGAPFVHFRRANNIEQSKNAKGTIAFPHHSTNKTVPDYDLNKYCEALNNLSKKYQPITICLHGRDMLSRTANIYAEKGFSVVTAGLESDKDFYRKFYNILNKSKYSTSNIIGSYTFYSVEMGIPFFLAGEESRTINYGDINVIEKDDLSDEQKNFILSVRKLFLDKYDDIPQLQREFVYRELGINDCLTGKELRKLLWVTYLKYEIKSHLYNVILKMIKLPLKCFFYLMTKYEGFSLASLRSIVSSVKDKGASKLKS